MTVSTNPSVANGLTNLSGDQISNGATGVAGVTAGGSLLRPDGSSIATGTAPTAYLGQFASGARIPTAASVGNTQMMCRSRYIARNSVVLPQFAWPNYYCSTSGAGAETGPGASSTITAALEYNGVAYQIRWNGATSVTVANGATTPLCEPVDVTIPAGAAYFIRTYLTNATGIFYESGAANFEAGDSPNGEDFRFAVSGLADQTNAVGAITGGTQFNPNRYGPILHVASITAPSVLIIGDSIEYGEKQSSRGGLGFGDKGVMSRIVGPWFGYANVGQQSQTAAQFVNTANTTQRVALAKYFTHVFNGLGVNDRLIDLVGGPQIYNRVQAVADMFPGKKVYTRTLMPSSIGTWTAANGSDQTTGTNATVISAYNTLMRKAGNNFQGVLDLSQYLELSSNPLKWYADGTTNFATPDGVHPSTAGAERIRALFPFNADSISR